MPTESDYTRQVVKSLKTFLPNAVTFKLADMFTMGVPDFSVTHSGITTWFEAKKLDQECLTVTSQGAFAVIRPVRHVPAVQWETLRRLVRGYLVIYTPHGHAMTKVNGLRDSVTAMRIKLMSMPDLVELIINTSKSTEVFNTYESN